MLTIVVLMVDKKADERYGALDLIYDGYVDDFRVHDDLLYGDMGDAPFVLYRMLL